MGEYEPGLPVDLESINEIAATATQGGEQAEHALGQMQEGFTKAHEASRTAHFAQGTGEGRGVSPGALAKAAL